MLQRPGQTVATPPCSSSPYVNFFESECVFGNSQLHDVHNREVVVPLGENGNSEIVVRETSQDLITPYKTAHTLVQIVQLRVENVM
jgi:hypothetical protein